MDNVLTVEDVARLLKVKPITVREMLREQRIRGFKVGKAWRTTEAMLTEDLATIARGDKPEPLEAQRQLAALPKRSRGRKPAAAPKAEKAAEKAVKRAGKAAAEAVAPEKRGPRKADADKPGKAGKPAEKAEDQQFLF